VARSDPLSPALVAKLRCELFVESIEEDPANRFNRESLAHAAECYAHARQDVQRAKLDASAAKMPPY
jgi:hypothetical protein